METFLEVFFKFSNYLDTFFIFSWISSISVSMLPNLSSSESTFLRFSLNSICIIRTVYASPSTSQLFSLSALWGDEFFDCSRACWIVASKFLYTYPILESIFIEIYSYNIFKLSLCFWSFSSKRCSICFSRYSNSETPEYFSFY